MGAFVVGALVVGVFVGTFVGALVGIFVVGAFVGDRVGTACGIITPAVSCITRRVPWHAERGNEYHGVCARTHVSDICHYNSASLADRGCSST